MGRGRERPSRSGFEGGEHREPLCDDGFAVLRECERKSGERESPSKREKIRKMQGRENALQGSEFESARPANVLSHYSCPSESGRRRLQTPARGREERESSLLRECRVARCPIAR